jgi:hypothetical protein
VLVASQELCAALAERGELPEGVTAERLLPVLLSLRATLELMAVEKRHGTAAHDALLAAMRRYYGRTLLARGDFLSGHPRAPRDHAPLERRARLAALHAEALLGTREPEHALFHTALVYGPAPRRRHRRRARRQPGRIGDRRRGWGGAAGVTRTARGALAAPGARDRSSRWRPLPARQLP